MTHQPRVPVVAVPESWGRPTRERAEHLGIAVQVVEMDNDGRLRDETVAPDAVVRAGPIRQGALERLLTQYPSIRWVHTPTAGVDGLLTPAVVDRGLTVTRTRGMHDRPVAEFAMALVLHAAKGLDRLHDAQRRHEWLNTFQPAQLVGRTLTIVGYGEIGRALARRARGFEMRVVGVRRSPQPDELADEVAGLDRLHDALRQADYVVLVAPSTPASRHMIGDAEIRAMPAHAYLINVGRGDLIDEMALKRLLDQGVIAGALLDTFGTEPLPADHPFWDHPRLVVTPHAAGLRTSGVDATRLDQLLENVRRLSRGEPLVNQVDLARGY